MSAITGDTAGPGGDTGRSAELEASAELALLSFAARLILSQPDRRSLLERGLESLLDFGSATRGGLWLLDADGGRLRLEGALGDERARGDDPMVAADPTASPWREALEGRLPQSFALAAGAGPPRPAASGGVPGRACLCVPLHGGANRVLGLVTLDRAQSSPLEQMRTQSVIVLQSILALGLEQAASRDRLLEANDELERLDAARSKTIDHLSHELKTPLSVLTASTALLARGSVRRDDARSASVLDRMDRSLSRLLELQEEACDIARAGADGAAEAALEPIDLAGWVPEVLAASAPLHRHRAVNVETELGAAPPVLAHEPMLRKALVGLLRNAVEATADGGWVRVSVSPRRAAVDAPVASASVVAGGREPETARNEAVVLEVADGGIGFDDATRGQLFLGFVHAGATDDYRTRRPWDFGAGGRGLDLLRTRRFADRHGVEIEVESTPGKGSAFRLVFPARLLRPPPSAEGSAGSDPRTGEGVPS